VQYWVVVYIELLRVHGTVQTLVKILLSTFISHWTTLSQQGATSKSTFQKHFFMCPQHVMFELSKPILNTLQKPRNDILVKSPQLVRFLQFSTAILKQALKIMLLIRDWIAVLRMGCLLQGVQLWRKVPLHRLGYRLL
jgi:hypothetical protein